MGRKTSKLVPIDNIRCGGTHHFCFISSRECGCADEGKADPVPIAKETLAFRHPLPDGCDNFVTPSCRDTISTLDACLFKGHVSTTPFGYFQARAELGFGLIDRVGE